MAVAPPDTVFIKPTIKPTPIKIEIIGNENTSVVLRISNT
jgi:hypothetical protein